jgi:hypothetical protein
METSVPLKNPFFANIEPRFEAFKEKMCKMAHKNKVDFDEDVFMDTIVRCMKTFTDKTTTNNEVDKYFWTAFRQNMLSAKTRNKFKEVVQIDTIIERIDDGEYNPDIDELVVIIEDEVRREFGNKIYEAWYLHICENKTYKELEALGYGNGLHNEFKHIKRHITNKLINKDANFKKLAQENHLI